MIVKEISGIKVEVRDPPIHGAYRGAMGKSTEYIECPFCRASILVYVWSFYGCGKKCDCGAKLSPHASYRDLSLEYER